MFIVVLSHGKLDRSFFHGRAKSANLQHTSGPKSPRKIIIRVLEKYVRLVTYTYTSPKVDVAASKLVPSKEKDRVLEVYKDFQNNLSFLVIILVITVSIRIFIYFF